MQRWMEVGFTEAQAALLSELVTKDYLREYLHAEFRRFKRDMLRWMLVMQAPVYAALIIIFLRLGV